MHYGEIKNYDIANGIGVRVSLFVSGCTNHCEHCFQPETWDFTHGDPFTEKHAGRTFADDEAGLYSRIHPAGRRAF